MANVSDLALDLAREFPRSPRATLAGYVVAARCLDKCRSTLAGTQGEYHFACPLDNLFFEFTGIGAEDFRDFVGTGADDEAVGLWIKKNAKAREKREIIQWNNDLRYKPINEMPIELQEFLEDYIPDALPVGAVVHVWFDVYDIEEGRMRPF